LEILKLHLEQYKQDAEQGIKQANKRIEEAKSWDNSSMLGKAYLKRIEYENQLPIIKELIQTSSTEDCSKIGTVYNQMKITVGAEIQNLKTQE